MPWKVSDEVNERMKFVLRAEEGEAMTALCREFGISRTTGYKYLERYRQEGPKGLYDRSSAPRRRPHKTAPDVEQAIVDLREKYGWGPRKLRKVLSRKEPGVKLPALSTIAAILKRRGLIEPRRKRPAVPPDKSALFTPTRANELWCADFKGQFRTRDGRYCYPLTITDSFSRSLLCCEALESTRGEPVMCVFERIFREFGLPETIRTDNGSPFASRALHGLSRLSVFWRRQGIRHQRIDPGHPEQNGQHERMHRTLKAEATRPPGDNLLQQQEQFDHFRARFNEVRPHEALGDDTPASWYRPSLRRFRKVGDLEYPLDDFSRRVLCDGRVHLPKAFPGRHSRLTVSRPLEGEVVGFRELDDGRWLVRWGDLQLGFVDFERWRIEPLSET